MLSVCVFKNRQSSFCILIYTYSICYTLHYIYYEGCKRVEKRSEGLTTKSVVDNVTLEDMTGDEERVEQSSFALNAHMSNVIDWKRTGTFFLSILAAVSE